MSSQSVCGNKEALVGYLYGECDGAERDALEAHLLTCLTCATELRELRGVRLAMTEWTPPDAELGFRIVQQPSQPARWFWPLPVWAQAAAAAVVFMAGVATMSNLEVRYGAADGLVVRTGWARSVDAAPVNAGGAMGASAAASGFASRADLKTIADQLRREFSAQTTRLAAASHDDNAPRLIPPRSVAGDFDPRRVQAMIDQSLKRQEDEFAFRLARLYRDVETNRRTEFAQFEQRFLETQHQTGAAIADQRQWMTNYGNLVVRASQRKP